jgi:ABC-type glycerol-3-phosphate transport system substrate-binding protein
MRKWIGFYGIIGLLTAIAMAACSERLSALSSPPDSSLDETPTIEATSAAVLPVRNTDPLAATNTPQPTTIPAAAQATLRVWWPDELYPASASTAEVILKTQFDGFTQTYSTYQIDVRRKRAVGLGGILPTLRAAHPVAPGVLPDLTLMRRADMATAAAEGLIVPLEDWAPSDILDDLLPGALELGTLDGVLYGVPYVLNLYHTVYRESFFETPPQTFDDILADKPRFLFPAAPVDPGTSVSWAVLLPYISAGGRLVDQNFLPVLDRDPLLALLSYFKQGVDAGSFDSSLLLYTQYNDYWNAFAASEANIIFLDSITYLSHKNDLQSVGAIHTPTLNGDPISALDGWMWVLTTQDPERQEEALAFFSWMMRVSQQGLYSEAVGIVPSQARALRLWEDQQYAAFVQELIPSALLIPNTYRSNSAAIALQESVKAVLEGETAETATDAALNSLVVG